MKKNTKILLLTIILILLLSGPLIYLLIRLLEFIILKLNIKPEGSKDAWISFAGSIIGGTITILVLYFTLKSEEEKRELNKAKEVRPFIVCTPNIKDENYYPTNIEDDQFIPYKLNIENISNNLVKDLRIVSEEVYELNSETEEYDIKLEKLSEQKNNYYIFTIMLDSLEMIKPNNSFNFQVNLIINNYKKAKDDIAKSFKVITTLKYKDILDIIEYTHQVEYVVMINYDRKGNIFYFKQDVKNKLLKEEKIKAD